MRTSRWQSFIKCFNSNKKTKEFKELSDKQLEKLEFTHLKEMYQNWQFVWSNKIGKKLYDRMRLLSKKYHLTY